MTTPPTRIAEAGPVVPASAAFRNLTDVVFVDNGGTAPATPDGNIESPFATFTAAQLTSPDSIYVVPGNYAAEGPLNFVGEGCSVIGMALANPRGFPPFQNQVPILPDLDLAPPAGQHEYLFSDVRVLIVGATADVATITFRDCYAGATVEGNYQTFIEGGEFSGRAGAQGLFARNMVSANGIVMTPGAAFNRIETSDLQSSLSFLAPGLGTVEMDVASVASLHRASAVIVDGGVRVLDGPRLLFTWGALSANTTEFLIPGSKDQAAAAALTGAWSSLMGTPGPAGSAWAHVIHAELSAAHAEDVTVTLFVGATPGAAAATALTATIPAGQLQVTFELLTELVIVGPGQYMGIEYTSAAALAANALEVQVGLT